MTHNQERARKIELKKQAKSEAGLVYDRFPQVSSIIIYMTYYHKSANPILMERMVNFFTTSYAYFNMECMIRGCDNGGFDLTPVITAQIKHHKKLVKGRMICKGKNSDLPSGHASISYEINIKYSKRSG